jgi:hypothetical protein
MGIHHHGLAGPVFWPFVIARVVLFALFVLVPWIIALAYVWRDARRRGQPGWLWALVGIFLSWFGILAYLVVRAFAPGTAPAAPAAPYAPYPPYTPASPNPPSIPPTPPAAAPPNDTPPTE